MCVVKLLLKAGAFVNQTNKYGYTALNRAAFMDHGYVVQLLLEAGANPNLVGNSGDTHLYWAAWRGNGYAANLPINNL